MAKDLQPVGELECRGPWCRVETTEIGGWRNRAYADEIIAEGRRAYALSVAATTAADGV